MALPRIANGALAGAIAAGVWAAQQPADKRLFGTRYDDTELLGKLVTRDPAWPAVGAGMHVANGAAFGAVYSALRPLLPGPPVARAVTLALVENFGSWGAVSLVDRFHPARKELEPLSGNVRALAAATWRHALFGVLLGVIERRLNPAEEAEPLEVPVSSNGHGSIEHAAVSVEHD
ncbi:MAG: hypothetical protein H0V29_12210 [Thermoleophilaceae bacterium]|nr:hypothetical protein [Thermoleophilaceae bacterium]